MLQGGPALAGPPGLDLPNDTQDIFPAIGEDPEGSFFEEPAMAHPMGFSSQSRRNYDMGDTQDIFPAVGEDPEAWETGNNADGSGSSFGHEAANGVASNTGNCETTAAAENTTNATIDQTNAVPRRRCRTKTSVKQLQLENNIRVAYNTPLLTLLEDV